MTHLERVLQLARERRDLVAIACLETRIRIQTERERPVAEKRAA